jgi:HlyD family secretion protein
MKNKMLPAILLIIAFTVGGVLMMMEGNDAVTLANNKKASLLTADTVNISFQGVGGRVTAIQASEQQDVKTGDVLMTLDTTDIDLQIAQLNESLNQQNIKIQQAQLQTVRPEDLEKQLLLEKAAQDNLNIIHLNFDRSKALFEAGALSKSAMDTASNQLEIAKNTLAQQQATVKRLQAQNQTDSRNYAYNVELLNTQKDALAIQLQALQQQKQRMTLTTPSDGKVIKITPKVGENISSAAVAAIIQSQQLYFNIYVDESQVSLFKIDNNIPCTVKAQNKNIVGTVKSIVSAPQYASQRMSRDKGVSDANVYLIRIDVPTTPELLSGMTMEVDIYASNI